VQERGQVSLEIVILMPLFLAVIFTIITASLFYFGKAAAQSAAAACAETTRTLDGTVTAGQAAASNVLTSADILTNPHVTADKGAAQTTCTVSGAVLGPISLGLPTITRTVTMPTERTTQP
ncbi:TadE/TadG family type IV pilus assembly protein, partial [Luteococcus sp.]|uniref:TadE/TadG family type IV pilus assembly protein n=1 Tax=Luteococcus sp. TaxID=1969402 RepID=UPI003735CBB3